MAELLDRTQAPQFRPVTEVPLMVPKKLVLSNGIPVFLINSGTQEVVKIEIWSNAGSRFAALPVTAGACAKLMTEGTTTRSAEDVANAFDLYGAHVESASDKENMHVSLYSMNRFLESTLEVFKDVVLNPSFDPNEVRTYASKRKQQLEEGLETVGTLVSRDFTKHLFGKDHAFGKLAEPESFADLNSELLSAFHKQRFLPNISRILCSGMIPDNLLEKLEAAFGQIELSPNDDAELEFPTGINTPKIHREKEGAVQNAIRIGRPLFDRSHPDFIGMQVLSVTLGGYFGSRLMTNIREDKGYTYGIGSSVQTFRTSGYFAISTEVGSEVAKDALREIYFEIDRLRNEPVPEEELTLVKNYLMGVQLKSTDGPFSLAAKWNGLINFGLSTEDHNNFITQMLAVDSKRIQQLANRYLQEDMLLEVIAGKI
jgi:zinc protease